MVTQGKIDLKRPFQMTYGDVNGQSIPVVRIYYTIDGEGDYSIMVPRIGFTWQVAEEAVRRDAEQYIMLARAFT